MITFTKHPKLDLIQEIMGKFEPKNTYQIYPIVKQKKTPCILVEMDETVYNAEYWNIQNYFLFLLNNGINYSVIAGTNFNLTGKDNNTIHISIREDVLEHYHFSLALIVTAIQVAEETIKFGNREINAVIKKPAVFD